MKTTHSDDDEVLFLRPMLRDRAEVIHDTRTGRVIAVRHHRRLAQDRLEVYMNDPRLPPIPVPATPPTPNKVDLRPSPAYTWLGFALLILTAVLAGCGVGQLLCVLR